MENHSNLLTEQRNTLKGRWEGQVGPSRWEQTNWILADPIYPLQSSPTLPEGFEKNIFCFIHPKASRKQHKVSRSWRSV